MDNNLANVKKWVATSVRALANEPSAYYRGGVLYIKGKPLSVHSPHLQLFAQNEKQTNLRGVADGIALRLLHSDPVVFQQYCPEETIGKLVYELLEQLRVEASPDVLPGMKSNLTQRFLFWAEQTSGNGLTETEIGMLLFTITAVVWSRLTSIGLPEHLQDVIEATRMSLSREMGDTLRLLRQQRFNQAEYAKTSLSIVAIIENRLVPDDDENSTNEEQVEAELKQSLNLLFFPSDLGQESAQMSTLEQYMTLNPNESLREYTVFTTDFDQEDRVIDLVRLAQLEKFREHLDEQIKRHAISYVRVAHHAKKLFTYRQSNAWLFAQDVGSIDPKQLPQMIADPDYYFLYRQQMVLPEEDNVVSILIDNSGSMSNHIPTIAIIIDLLVRGFEVAKIKTEILGFTTALWNGGKSFKQWQGSGRPANPGRLNDLQHYIYKDTNEKWQHSRNAIAGLFKSDLFRESLDGEGVAWAVQRLRRKSGQRKTLLVISDGSPMDTATQKANDQPILDSHLLKVVSEVEQQGDVNLCALGVGLDMSAYFNQSYAVQTDQPLTMKVITDIIDLLAARYR